jgi:hypothetical protein
MVARKLLNITLYVQYIAFIVTTEVECVNFAVRAESLNISKWIFLFDDLDTTTSATVQMF